jgi:hypothetical protein
MGGPTQLPDEPVLQYGMMPDAGMTYDVIKVNALLTLMRKASLLQQFMDFVQLRTNPDELLWLMTPGGLLGWLDWQIAIDGREFYSLPRKRKAHASTLTNRKRQFQAALQHLGVRYIPISEQVRSVETAQRRNDHAVGST